VVAGVNGLVAEGCSGEEEEAWGTQLVCDKKSTYKRVQRTGRGRDGGNEDRKSEGKKRSLELTEMEIDVQEQRGRKGFQSRKQN
jgi:hypothetical protein